MDVSKVKDIIEDGSVPIPWDEGDNIPWYELGFSKRMLEYHLSQDNDLASRRFSIIDQHVDWIHTKLLKKQPCKILDICCGPGFYTQRLAKLGHNCIGIDYSPASIEYALIQSQKNSLDCKYILGDIREAGFGNDHDLVMLIFGEFNVFSKEQANRILSKAYQALKPGGLIVLEVHTFECIKKIGTGKSIYNFLETGLFCDKPHTLVEKPYWDDKVRVATRRFLVIQSPSFEVTRYAASYQSYTESEYIDLMESSGFCDVQYIAKPDFMDKDAFSDDLVFLVAQKS